MEFILSDEREWNSPLMERQRYDEEQKSGYDAPRKFGPSTDPRRLDQTSGPVAHRKCPSPGSLDPPAPRFERERLSPIHQREPADTSPIPRFESPNSEHSDDGPLNLDGAPSHPHPPKSAHKGPGPGGQLASLRLHRDSPGHTPPYDGGHPTSLLPVHRGASRPHPPGWYEGGGPEHYDDCGPHPHGPGRLEGGGPLQRFDGHGPMRGGDGMGWFDGPPHPHGPNRFDGAVRCEGQGPGSTRFERYNNMGQGPGSGPIQRPMRFEAPLNQMGPVRFEGSGPRRFDGPMQPGPRFDIPHQGGAPGYEQGHGQQGPVRFPPQHNLQPAARPLAAPMYENPMGSQQNFSMAQHFPEPVDPQFPVGQMAYSAQATPFNQPGSAPFYNPSAPGLGLQQPVSVSPGHACCCQSPVAAPQTFTVSSFQVNLLGNLSQPFQSQTVVPFGHQSKPRPFVNANHVAFRVLVRHSWCLSLQLHRSPPQKTTLVKWTSTIF